MKLFRKKLDKSITFFWLFMDFAWMCEYYSLATFFFAFSVLFSAIDFIFSKYKLSGLTETVWVLANGLWMLSDVASTKLLLVAQILSAIAIMLTYWMWHTNEDFFVRFRFKK